MAICYISEYPGGQPLGMPASYEPSITDQTAAIGGASTQSAPFTGDTKMIYVNVDSVCSIVFGPNPTATTSNKRMSANQSQFFIVQSGHRLAVIANV
jgi:hypothetical protein